MIAEVLDLIRQEIEKFQFIFSLSEASLWWAKSLPFVNGVTEMVCLC